ncbi:uncharacterized protein DUF5077 [Lacibacter cauensis]|uniref:Uncharacterized protein DUF5077 n=1 Tax=Lacibacter cauensis TaxID=510947 RepID=A0A562SJK2_9BACT|nr:DUF3472 domain-containing protein [Lacibacter cauensis]TWI81338.1 uncharacterized protein DUF5077 [Lacibacter cauensis]
MKQLFKCSFQTGRWLGLISMLMLPVAVLAQQEITVPLGGNSWVTAKAGSEKVTNNGWMNWQHADAVYSTYVYVRKKGTMEVAAAIAVPEGRSVIQCTVNGKAVTTSLEGTSKRYSLGQFAIADSGYVKIEIKGISKTGTVFATMDALQLSGTAVDAQTLFVKNNEGNYFYWGRRGPSVHLGYDVSEVKGDVEWFYNEITVPAGNDVIGSYYMANGFAEGYFGMQVNSATERRILFSVWSPFATDDPKQIPADKKILLVKKGNNVYTGEFGNEGSGGQSYLKYNWKAGETCKFLLRAKPVADNYTNYTAYFYAADAKKWLLIASFNRPATSTYLKRLHSFLENFEPNTGYLTRKAWYHNQWVCTSTGEWKQLTKARFTGDATAQKEYRVDYAGGQENGKFFLQNCGFFNNRTTLRSEFVTRATAQQPVIDFTKLD